MEKVIKPFEYCYVNEPFFSSGEVFFKVIIQDLCLKEILNLKLKWIKLNPSDKHFRLRPFIEKGKNFDSYSTDSISEQFVLNFFKDEQPLRTYQIRNKLNKIFSKDIEKFKEKFIYPDIKNKKLCYYSFLLTSYGRQQKKKIKIILKNIEMNVGQRLENNIDDLILLINSIDTNIHYCPTLIKTISVG